MKGCANTENNWLVHIVSIHVPVACFSHFAQTIQAKVAEIWKDQTSGLTCVVATPTGLAAFNVGGVTVHRLFQLPIKQLNIGHSLKLPKR